MRGFMRSPWGQGKAVAEAVRAIGVTEATYYRWRAEWASPLGVEGLLTNPITSGGGYGGEANPAALLLSFGSKPPDTGGEFEVRSMFPRDPSEIWLDRGSSGAT
jgi:hypothetical protein